MKLLHFQDTNDELMAAEGNSMVHKLLIHVASCWSNGREQNYYYEETDEILFLIIAVFCGQ